MLNEALSYEAKDFETFLGIENSVSTVLMSASGSAFAILKSALLLWSYICNERIYDDLLFMIGKIFLET